MWKEKVWYKKCLEKSDKQRLLQCFLEGSQNQWILELICFRNVCISAALHGGDQSVGPLRCLCNAPQLTCITSSFNFDLPLDIVQMFLIEFR